ncbi:MAG TPA: Gfo/Idh/MocA family oxidoreductase [Candidatus Kapabacteria bacterium]|nr:Gfo/Idh/MocA family oxidoreductase [Candidatus Kapabacteria bacterium]
MKNNAPLRVGVIGVGHLGSIHAALWKEVSGAELEGVFDTDSASAERIAAKHGVTAYQSIEQMLNAVDAVSIVTPTSYHYETALLALNAGKHCMIEKPITSTVQQAKEIAALAGKKKLKIQVGHIERFNPALLALEKTMINPLFIESHRLAQFSPRATDVAVVHDLMIHDIDVILSLVQSPVVQIDANGVSVVSDTVDIANARIRFANGCVANVTASRISQRQMRKMRIFQNDAYISIDFAQPVVEVFKLIDSDAQSAGAAPTMKLGQIEKGKQKRTIVYEQPEIKQVNALKHELELFRNAIVNDTPTVVTAEEGTQALEVAEEIMGKITGER